MKFKELKWYIKLLIIVMFIICSPFILFGWIIFFFLFIVPSPIEIMIYKNSSYYKNFKRKYHFGITHNIDFQVINKIINSSISIDIVFNKEKEFSYLKKNNLVFLYSWFEVITFDEEDQKWKVAETDNDELLDIESAIAEQRINLLDADKELQVVVLIGKSEFMKDELFFVTKDSGILIFENIEALVRSVENYN